MSKVVYEGWMARYGRRKIGRSFIHMRYFVLETRMLGYYKKKPQENMIPIKTLAIDGNCRVEDRGLKMHHGNTLYVLCIYNKKEKHHRLIMAAFNIQEALIWKEKIEHVIDKDVTEYKEDSSFPSKLEAENGRLGSSSDHDSRYSAEEEEISHPPLLRRTTMGNGPPESVYDWTRDNVAISDQASSRKHWRLVRCQNGLRIFEELVQMDALPRSCGRAMKAVGAVEASCDAIFELVMGMGGTRYEWDCSFNFGSLVDEVDGHTAIVYHRLQLDWYPMIVWPRDLCYVRYWRRNDDGSYVVLFQSREHPNCGPQPGFVRAHIESGGFNISPLKSRDGKPRSQVQHLMQIDLKGWGVGYLPSFQQHCLLHMLNNVAGLREWFAQTDGNPSLTGMPVMVGMQPNRAPKRSRKFQEIASQPGGNVINRPSTMMDEESDDDEEFHLPEQVQAPGASRRETEVKLMSLDEEPLENIDLSVFSGNLRKDDNEKSRDCWRISEGNNFRVRSRDFLYDESKIPAGKHMMALVAVDWFKDVKRMDHVARRKGCAVQVAAEKGLFSIAINIQVPGSTNYSMVFYFVMKGLVPGSLLQRFVDGDDEFRNSKFKIIPSVPKGSWIVRQSVGAKPCLLGKALDITYIRGPSYLEIDVDIGSSTVANGVLGIVCGAIKTLVVDMAFLVQADTLDELPERLIGAVRVCHVELSSAITPVLEDSSSAPAE
ncbi:protein ENHANCED DISEASE RESISTANCE 2-like protein [Carex littledalei]|uniref:Protein ENHANCED DISEASE RESISTANCE 2-like protein n=1 Tax=Carex littledalei TaxID=544730 RepID=A0A833VEI6_9POAL|nr:protein ENHANCED DISEASE RESISTANCE 2-like protein [Carex littledalei]